MEPKLHQLSIGLLICACVSSRGEDLSAGAYAKVYAKRQMVAYDTNHDGLIQEKEIEQKWRALRSLDTDHDGAISLDELTKAPIPYLKSEDGQKLNVLYKKTSQEDLYLDLYYPTQKPAGKLPVIFYTHGGGWTTGSKQGIASGGFKEVYSALLAKGFAVVAINYRLWEKEGSVTMRDCVIDTKDAVRYISKHSETLGLDPMRCFVHGDSAGGHLAQMLLLTSPESLPGDLALTGANYKMIAGVSWYGPCDFEKSDLFNYDNRADFRDRFGPRILKADSDPKEKTTLYREMSPIQYLKKSGPPLLMIQGDQDPTIPVKHAYYMKEKADAAGAPVEIMIIQNAAHNWKEVGGTMQPNRDAIVERTVNFILDHSKQP